MNTRMLVHSILLAAGLAGATAAGAHLPGLYQRALTSDPLIREADANRLAARESKPQALAAMLPQVNGSGRYDDSETDNTSTEIDPPEPPSEFIRNSDGTLKAWQLQLRQSVFS